MTRKTARTTLRANFDYLHASFGVKRIGLFGSFASGTAKKNSDIDLVVEFDGPIGLKFMEFSERLEKMLGRRVDILTPEGIRAIRSRTVMNNILRSVKYV